MPRSVAVTFEPSGATVWVPAGTTVLEAARSADVIIAAPCGGRGICGACAVRVVTGQLAPIDDAERSGLTRAPQGVRLACRARVEGPVTVRPVIVQGATSVEVGTCGGPLVAGVDLGTTTVAAVVLDPATGREIGRMTVPNRQASWGADVLARVSAACDGAAGELRRLAEESVLEALSGASGGNLEAIERVVVAGNTVMSALFSGADASSLTAHPFELPDIPAELAGPSSVLGHLAPGASVRLVPAIAGFVGGDALAAALATGTLDGQTQLLVDIGTNAEVVLAHDGELFVASAAAGPAFEGQGIACAGPGVPGAVAAVTILDGDVRLDVIGGEGEPGWLSGSGLVSALAELRRSGVLQADGAFSKDALSDSRMRVDSAGVRQFSFAPPDSSDAGCLSLSQLDVRTLQLAKGAVRAGIERVLAAGGVAVGELDHLWIAGAFGSALRVADLVDIGVVPRGAEAVTAAVGNAALAGTAIAVLQSQAIEEAAGRMSAATHVDLAGDPVFMSTLLTAVSLEPYGD